MKNGTLCLARNVAFWSSVVGQLCSLMALCVPQWLTLSSGLLESEKYVLGLWETCVTQDTGDSVCQGPSGLGDLDGDVLVTRILMCAACITGALGLMIAILGLTCLRSAKHPSSSPERHTNVVGGALLGLAGLATLVPASYMARVTVWRFWGTESPNNGPHWEYGASMFLGWIGGFFLLIGALLLIVSQLYANRLAKKSTSYPSKLDFSRKVPFGKIDFV